METVGHQVRDCDDYHSSIIFCLYKMIDQCACEIGWEGDKCDKCVKLPGCRHGNCSEAFQCSCLQGMFDQLILF